MVSHPFLVDRGSDDYGVSLDIFEGPLDLLMYLIRKDEIDIYDIPVAEITRQFLAYVDLIHSLDLEQAGDFLVMAATLMKIKSRMLLPADPEAGEEEAEDPREELIRRLLEYQQVKDVAEWLEDRRSGTRDVFYRGAALHVDEEETPEDEGYASIRPVDLYDLLAAFKHALDAAPKTDYHEVGENEVTTEERAEYVHDVLTRRRQVTFFELVTNVSRVVVVVTFIAVLELVKGGRATVKQSGPEHGFWIYHREPEPEAEVPQLVVNEEGDAEGAPGQTNGSSVPPGASSDMNLES